MRVLVLPPVFYPALQAGLQPLAGVYGMPGPSCYNRDPGLIRLNTDNQHRLTALMGAFRFDRVFGS